MSGNRLFWLVFAVALGPLAGASRGAATHKSWVGRHEQIQGLLRTAEVVAVKPIGQGVTNPWKVTLRHNGETFAAAYKPIKRGRYGGFWESHEAEVAAYRVDTLLRLDMVPPTVLRSIRVQGARSSTGSTQLWVDGCELYRDVEGDVPKTVGWNQQLSRMKMFDVLIGNSDRNAQNFLACGNAETVLIDHSRGFVSGTAILKDETKLPVQFDRGLVATLKTFTLEELEEALKPLLSRGQIKAVLKRRDGLLAHMEALIAERGEASVMFR